VTPTDLTELDATDQAQMVRSRAVTARRLVELTLGRIDDVEPRVNAFRVVMAEGARSDADRIDALSDAERDGLPLAGVPVAIKDDTDVRGQSTMWGSAIDRGAAGHDAVAVRRLREAGAVIIGKTNVPELTLWPWTSSQRWGDTRNPWNLERTPGGSSGGSAAAVCTGMAAMALGSDGGGSIRYPAGLTGLVGVKPQRGRVPLGAEHASGWHGLVVLGPLTRSVRDAALFLDIVSDEALSSTFRDAIGRAVPSLRIALATNPPPGTRVTLSAERRRVVEDAATLLGDLGHTIVRLDIDYGLASLWNSTVRLLAGAQDDTESLSDRDHLEPRTRAVARLGRLLPTRLVERAIERERVIATAINQAFDDVDVVLTPLCASPAPRLDECPSHGGLRSLGRCNTSAWLVPWNVIGQPALTVPMGFDGDDLPTAIQLAGRPDDEATLIALAAQIEAVRPVPRWSNPLPALEDG
jgi:amidase